MKFNIWDFLLVFLLFIPGIVIYVPVLGIIQLLLWHRYGYLTAEVVSILAAYFVMAIYLFVVFLNIKKKKPLLIKYWWFLFLVLTAINIFMILVTIPSEKVFG